MSIEIEGGMIIGRRVSDMPDSPLHPSNCEDFDEKVEEYNLDIMRPYFDSTPEDWVIGIEMKDVPVEELDEDWLIEVGRLNALFHLITDYEAELIGTQNVF